MRLAVLLRYKELPIRRTSIVGALCELAVPVVLVGLLIVGNAYAGDSVGEGVSYAPANRLSALQTINPLHFLDGIISGGVLGATLVVMLIVFLLGFILDFMEITFVVVPIVGPVLLSMGVDPVWLGVMIALNLQTSFLTPPFGFALFYLRGVAPPEVRTSQIYKGVIPFILIQLTMLGILALFPELATWLPGLLYG